MTRLKKISIILVVGLLTFGCTKLLVGEDPKNTPVQTFESFWHGIDATWPEFESKHVNWDSVYNVYRSQVTTSTPDAELQRIFKAMIKILHDGHTNVFPNAFTPIGYYPPFSHNYFGFTWVRTHYNLNIKGNASIVYGRLGTDVGFIYIANFSGEMSQYAIIDDILTEFADVKGIIIDVRDNTGGNTQNSLTIASRFADRERQYEFVRYRLNAETKTMGDFIGYSIQPEGPRQFKGKVAVLSNRYSFSATEDFIFMMTSFPNVTIIGDNTGGGSGSRPILKELPNGWAYRVSTTLVSGLDKIPITDGIAPDIRVSINKNDSINAVDPVIETAKATVLK
jgi:hypothetical protein